MAIFEARIYTFHTGKVPEWEKGFATAYAAREKYSKLYGMWHTDIGPLNQVIHIWQYDSLQQRADIRAAAAKDPSGLWPPKGADMILSQEVDIIDPVKGFEPLQPGTGHPAWELRVYTYAGGQTGKAAAAFGEADQFLRRAAYLADRAGGAVERVEIHRLDRIDDDEIGRFGRIERIGDVANAARGGETDRVVGDPEPLGP